MHSSYARDTQFNGPKELEMSEEQYSILGNLLQCGCFARHIVLATEILLGECIPTFEV